MKRKICSLLVLVMLFVSVITNSLYIVWADSEGLIKNVIFMIPDGGGFALFDLANGVKEMGGFKEGLFPNATISQKDLCI